jgi:hypothetical protein
VTESNPHISNKLKLALQFIESKRHLGIELVDMDGRPTLHADPGMTPDQAERWQVMSEAVEQLVACRSELNCLLRDGKSQLPKRKGYGR